ncbi:HEAT repeat domain-containing protein [Roseiconus nitratireducens]|uniref:HEAT repeat domain-containing protein n=1 Tax=Roseiconus nitratireducens TaxID=2605748 RepID=A0A5M6D0K9_9BACT|nr:HEAT repeat domain-containing protein [Roseiconus nitratireducens]KAA5541011.1 HEAT repeat domain-containing protein [Roseiconus nitratireducens]
MMIARGISVRSAATGFAGSRFTVQRLTGPLFHGVLRTVVGLALLLPSLVVFAEAPEGQPQATATEPANFLDPGDASPPTIAGRTLEDWGNLLESDNRTARLRAIRSVGYFGAPAAETLHQALEHSDPAVRYLAATHLGRIGGDPLADATESLTRLAKPDKPDDQPLSVRMAAAYALCAQGQTEDNLPILIDALSYPERGTACTAADLMGRLGARASAAIETLEKVRAENKPGVKGGDYHLGGAALNALRKIRGEG